MRLLIYLLDDSTSARIRITCVVAFDVVAKGLCLVTNLIERGAEVPQRTTTRRGACGKNSGGALRVLNGFLLLTLIL